MILMAGFRPIIINVTSVCVLASKDYDDVVGHESHTSWHGKGNNSHSWPRHSLSHKAPAHSTAAQPTRHAQTRDFSKPPQGTGVPLYPPPPARIHPHGDRHATHPLQEGPEQLRLLLSLRRFSTPCHVLGQVEPPSMGRFRCNSLYFIIIILPAAICRSASTIRSRLGRGSGVLPRVTIGGWQYRLLLVRSFCA